MLKQISILLLVLLSNLFSFSQKNYERFKIEKKTEITDFKYSLFKDFSGEYSDLFSSFYDGKLYFFIQDYTNFDSLRVFCYDVNASECVYFDLNLQSALKDSKDKELYIESFASNGEYLVFWGYPDKKAIFFFKREGDSFVYDFKIADDKSLFQDQMEFLDNGELLGLRAAPKFGEENFAKLSLLDLETKKIRKTIDIAQNITGYNYIYPYKLLDVSENSIFFSHRGEYKIEEYDFDLNKQSEIIGNESYWIQTPQNLSDSIMNLSPYAVDRSARFLDLKEKYSTVYSISVDGSKVFVFYENEGERNNTYFDVWERENSEWILKGKNIKDYSKSVRKLVKRTLSLDSDFKTKMYFTNSKIVRLRADLPKNLFLPMFLYMPMLEKYVAKNNIPFVVDILSFE
ncbi:MAG: hypothetical protein IKV46_04010 [Bacteroidales bacterium]|nr:hypothetical protein [Bacteroidales bacterium]